MRLIPRHRNRYRKPPRIAITQAEITADLHYPGGARPGRPTPLSIQRSGR